MLIKWNLNEALLSSENYLIKSEQDKVNVFPNPAKDIVHLTSNSKQEYQYEIFTASGISVLKGTTENQAINVQSLSKGEYVIKLYGINSEYSVVVTKI